MDIEFPEKFEPLFEDWRFKVFYGGRGSGKTTQIAVWLLLKSLEEKVTILCCREFQTSIKNSVHAVFCEEIERLGLSQFFTITYDKITSATGSIFIFAGISGNIDNIKSIPSIKYAWVEEAQTVSQRSWDVLIPTVRAPGSEIIISFNPYLSDDPVYKMFVTHSREDAIVVKVNWDDNPFLPEVLYDEMLACKESDYEKYLNVWEGECLIIGDELILNGKCEQLEFTPMNSWSGPYYGADFGFANDPNALVRCWVFDGNLFIEKEAYGTGIDIDKLPNFFLSADQHSNKYVIRADNSRPETISYLKKNGFDKIIGCQKGPNSVDDGIAFLRSFRKIYIHPRCTNFMQESRKYKFKVDKRTGDILPIPLDRHNHLMDALRYALEPMIKNRRPGHISIN